jgi:hypothetical protein
LQARLHASNPISSRGGCSDDGAGRVCGGASRPSARPCPRRSGDGRGRDVGRAARRSVRRGETGCRCSCRTPRRFQSTPRAGGDLTRGGCSRKGGRGTLFLCRQWPKVIASNISYVPFDFHGNCCWDGAPSYSRSVRFGPCRLTGFGPVGELSPLDESPGLNDSAARPPACGRADRRAGCRTSSPSDPRRRGRPSRRNR